MAKSLIVVESPTKAKTIQKYLGKDFIVKASMGHIKDLPVKELGVDIENGFKPKYITIRGKGKLIKELKEKSKIVDAIYIASDPDREGEAIAFHVAEEVGTVNKNIYRILLHEITKKAIIEALNEPGSLNHNKYESQQARRILDRLVGYKISPLLWKKVAPKLSAGRVQSVALRMIVEREREILAFVPQEYWDFVGHFKTETNKNLQAKLAKINGKKVAVSSEKEALQVKSEIENSKFKVLKVEKKKVKKAPQPPFITSKLQQDAYRFFKFPAKKTMQIAQSLYEGVNLGERGQVGLITYMRTDSVRVNPDAIASCREYIRAKYGEGYVPAKERIFKNKKKAQDAHEAIRPTDLSLEPDVVKKYLTPDQYRLYSLIFNRFVASQMKEAVYDSTTIEIGDEDGKFLFKATGNILVFDGHLAVYKKVKDEGEEEENGEGGEQFLPEVSAGDKLFLQKIEATQKFTKPKPRYTESTLIKALEENGVGRPSTYATIISTILEKEYVKRDKGKLVPTELGFFVNDALVSSFPDLINVSFTAKMEDGLDKIEEGKLDRLKLLKKFYKEFEKTLKKAEKEMKNMKVEALKTDIKCELCGSPMVIKTGKNGPFLACSAYPKCKNTMDYERDEKGNIIPIKREKSESKGKEPEKLDEKCPSCGAPLVVKKGRFGMFVACSNYPSCKYTRSLTAKKAPELTEFKCPMGGCDGYLVKRHDRRGRTFYGCSNYPKCKFTMSGEPVNKICPSCGYSVMKIVKTKNKEYIACINPKCNYKIEIKNNETLM